MVQIKNESERLHKMSARNSFMARLTSRGNSIESHSSVIGIMKGNDLLPREHP
jgi:hypothetical protein